MNYVFVFAIGIGIVAGLRSLLSPAVVAWAAHFGWLNLHGSLLAFMGSTAAVAIFSIFAIGELIADKLPLGASGIDTSAASQSLTMNGLVMVNAAQNWNLGSAVTIGGLSGASLCAGAGKSLVAGALLGGIGGVIGAFVGYEIRRRVVNNLHIKDTFVAICEDAVAIALACFVVWR